MKVLHVLDHSIPLHSGYTFRTRAILKQQQALGWDTVQITSLKHIAEGPDKEEVDALTFYRTRSAGGLLARMPVLNQWEVVSTLERRLDAVIPLERPDVLHAHSPSLTGVAAVRAGRRHGIPVVYECRAFWEDAAADHGTSSEGGLRYRLTKALETWVFRNADALTCICEGLRSDIVSRGIPASKVTVIPNAVDIQRFDYCPPRDDALGRELGLDDVTVLGFIGSFYGYEGLSLAVGALPKILESNPGTALLLVGGGPQEANLKRQVAELGLEERVLFTGRVPHDQVQRYYSLVDIFLYPRLHMRLTDLVTPLKPLEAMAQGKLVLASDVGGHQELIQDGVNSRLFRAGSSDALAAAVVDMLGQRDGWQAMREAGRQYVEQERNWPTSVDNYRDVYGGLLGRTL
jgi:PEP-CTERM/exosortase A-associated glycosyltransferase